MAAMSGSEFYNYVLRVFKRTDKETEVYEAITDAIMEMKLQYFHEDFKIESYTAGTNLTGDNSTQYKVQLPSDFGHLLGDVILLDDNGGSKPLRKLSKSTFDTLYPYPNESGVDTGVPKHFCIFSKQILIGPNPDSTSYSYQINYTDEEETQMASGTTSVPFTARYRWILRYFTLKHLYIGLGMDEEGAKWNDLGREGMQQIIANDEFNTGAPETVNYCDM